MQRSQLSWITAAISLAAALVWLALGQVVSGWIWIVTSLTWLAAAALQRFGHDAVEADPTRRLTRRFSRLLMFWS